MSEQSDVLAAPDSAFQYFLKAGKFMIQRSRVDGRYVFYPRVAAPGTGAELEWVEASGRGVVYSTTVTRVRPPASDYNIALVELDEGPRLMSRIDGIPPEEVRIGMRVAVRIVADDKGHLLTFVPAEATT